MNDVYIWHKDIPNYHERLAAMARTVQNRQQLPNYPGYPRWWALVRN